MSEPKWKEIVLETGEVWDKSTPLEGIFHKVETNVGPNNSILYSITTPEGIVGVWGSTVLDDKMKEVPLGASIKIVYEGKQKSKNGTQYHNYRLYVAEGTDLDVSTPTSGYLKAKKVASQIGNGEFTDADIPPEFRS